MDYPDCLGAVLIIKDEAQNKLRDLVAQALAGNEVIITEHGTPVTRLVSVVAHSQKKRLRVAA